MSPQQDLGVGINFLVQSGRAVLFPSTSPRTSAETGSFPIGQISRTDSAITLSSGPRTSGEASIISKRGATSMPGPSGSTV